MEAGAGHDEMPSAGAGARGGGRGAAPLLWRVCVVLALAGVLVWLSVAAMPRMWWSGALRATERFSGDVFVVRAAEGGGFEILDLELESADRLTRLIVERAEDVAKARVDAAVGESGPGHTFRRVERQVIEVTPLSARAAWSEVELAAARRAVAAWARERSPRIVAVGLAEGDVDRARIDARGFALNLGTMALVVIVLVQFARLPRAIGAAAAGRRERGGRCGACGYDLSAVEPAADGEVTCPECGAAAFPRRG